MPIYEYRCKKCGHEMELLVKSSSGSKPKCEKCGSTSLEKQFSAFGVGGDSSDPMPSAGSSGACSTGSCPFA
jgi:putative FmdB family regulatory protein